MTAFQHLLDAARMHGLNVQERGDQAFIQCPSHNDGRPSLSVKKIEGSVLLYCFAGCDTADVLAELDLKPADLFDDERGFTYEYPGGRQVHRTPNKEFHQKGNKGDSSLYHSDRLVGGGPIYVVEGEKDVLAIEAAGGQAVTAPNGASARPDRYDWECLRGKIVHIVADCDEPGRKRAQVLADYLDSIAMSVGIYEPAEGKDAADHIAAGRPLSGFKCITTPDVLNFSQALDEWRKWRESPHIKPIRTPWLALNTKLAGGLHPGQLIVVGARTGVGKSIFGVNVLTYAAVNLHPGLVISVEMPHVEILSRIIAAQAHVPYENITRRDFDEHLVNIDQWIAGNRELPMYICDKPTLSIEEVAAKCRMLRDSRGLAVAFIDYAQLIRASSSDTSRQEQVSHIARSSKLLAMELNIPVVLAAQLNRNADEEVNGAPRLPRMRDLRESGELEQSADVVLLLHRSSESDQFYVLIAKNRAGKTGQVSLREVFNEARIDAI